jgi:hypothetical protein
VLSGAIIDFKAELAKTLENKPVLEPPSGNQQGGADRPATVRQVILLKSTGARSDLHLKGKPVPAHVYTDAIQFREKFKRENEGAPPCTGDLIWILSDCGVAYDKATLTLDGGWKLLRKTTTVRVPQFEEMFIKFDITPGEVFQKMDKESAGAFIHQMCIKLEAAKVSQAIKHVESEAAGSSSLKRDAADMELDVANDLLKAFSDPLDLAAPPATPDVKAATKKAKPTAAQARAAAAEKQM